MAAETNDELYQASVVRSMFATGEDDDDDDHEDISQYTWNSKNDNNDEENVSIIYHLAFLAPGHGDSVWNASSCISEHLLVWNHPKLFGPKICNQIQWPPKKAIEFGAGAALPSIVLLNAGAEKIICTDDSKANEVTFRAIQMSVDENCKHWGITDEQKEVRFSIQPHTWGDEIDKLKSQVGGDGSGNFDVLIASDCIYNPNYHKALLQSAASLISIHNGIFIVGYSFHPNVPPAKVIEFFDLAKSDAFCFNVISEFVKEYKEGQAGIGDNDPKRGSVYVKVLAHRDSQYCK